VKKFFVLLVLVGFVFASEFIPRAKIESLAHKFISQKFGSGYMLKDIVTYYGVDDGPNAYGFVFQNQDLQSVTIVLGARVTCSPVFEIYERIPNYYTNLERARNETEKRLSAGLEFEKIYYFGPLEEYFSFKNKSEAVLVNTYSLKIFDKGSFFEKIKPERNGELEQILENKWDRYLNDNILFGRDTVLGYIDSVPYIDWVYGCSPTAASMILWYWDPRGYGKLADYFFTHWDNPEGEWNDCANVNRELALRMYTDTLSGGTYISNIGPGIVATCNTNNGYSFSSQTSSQGGQWNQYQFSWIKTEIDAQRPCHWNVLHYQGDPNFNHSVTGVGYAYGSSLPDTFVIVHETWTTSEPWWPLWTYANGYQSYDYVVTVIPGGSNANNVLLTFPTSGSRFFKGLKYRIKWQSFGTNVDHIKIWYSIGRNASSYDSTYWTLITSAAPNTGSFIWTVPNQDSALRVNIFGLGSSNQLYAADGVFSPCYSLFPTSSTNLTLVGHLETNGIASDISLNGNYAYIADGVNGLVVADFSDSSIPDDAFRLALPGDNGAIEMQSSYLYMADKTDTVRIVSIVNPTNPSQIGNCYLNADQPTEIDVQDSVVCVACRGSGIAIVDVTTPSAPSVITYFDTPGQAYDLEIADTLLYVADGTTGLLVINVVDPSNPSIVGSYNTNGIAQGVNVQGNILYVADGSAGIKIFDISDPTNPQILGAFDTPGTAKEVIYKTPSILFVPDGTGMRVLDVSTPSSPNELGFISSFGTSTKLAYAGKMIYLVDGSDGIYLIHGELTNVNESSNCMLEQIVNLSSPQTEAVKFNLHFRNPMFLGIKIYDASGRMVKSFGKKKFSSGNYYFCWKPEMAGVYFVQIENEETVEARKVVFLK
jgi:hypothetical protein